MAFENTHKSLRLCAKGNRFQGTGNRGGAEVAAVPDFRKEGCRLLAAFTVFIRTEDDEKSFSGEGQAKQNWSHLEGITKSKGHFISIALKSRVTDENVSRPFVAFSKGLVISGILTFKTRVPIDVIVTAAKGRIAFLQATPTGAEAGG